MPATHHSHSGEFCGDHAQNTLEENINRAISLGMTHVALTEHIPRSEQDLYPAEREGPDGGANQPAILSKVFDSYVQAARNQQRAHAEAGDCLILVGCEGEWIRPAESAAQLHHLMTTYSLDYFIGSVHHVLSVPIDYSREYYERARDAAGGSDDALACAYFDAQHEMLLEMRPAVVGHFDLIRLYSDEPDRDWNKIADTEVWNRIRRNLTAVMSFGGVLEVNSAALRKGLQQPYPRHEICKEWLSMGGLLVMSDDSHGVDHVGACYLGVRAFLKDLGVKEMGYLARHNDKVEVKTQSWAEFENHKFWTLAEKSNNTNK